MEYVLFVDAMNLAWKAMHAYELSTVDGVDTSAIYGFMSQLASVLSGKKLKTVVVWDGGYPERFKLSQEGLQKGIVNKLYKESRHSKDEDEAKSMNRQILAIKELLNTTDIKQVTIDGQEADDVIASYCEKVKGKLHALCFTCDHDYYQIIDTNVSIISRYKSVETIWSLENFIDKYKIQPYQWVEVGALCGDTGDCIVGVPGCGEDTAVEYIREYHTANDVIARMSEKFSPLRASCPDIDSQEGINALIEIGGEKNYSGCYPGMPFSGVALALARGEIKKVKKTELKFAMYQERIRLAHKLKAMNRNIDVPNFNFKPVFNLDAFSQCCKKYEMLSLIQKADKFKIS